MKRVVLVLSIAVLVTGFFGCVGELDLAGDSSTDAGPAGASRPTAGTGAGSDGAAPCACPVAAPTDPLVIVTDKGLVQGKTAGSGFAFLGIPYAKPPVGPLRFQPPVPTDCWSGVADATRYGNVCAQWSTTGALTGSEDCLSLNVWIPALPSSSSKPLPVLVWVYGGGDIVGGSTYPGTDGETLANAENAVVVSFNYRLGALGFLAHPALRASNPLQTTGNYGLLDALLALRWVQDNIASFGGDKTRVMLFGQSAGAINTCALVSSNLAHGLFSSALMQSGNCAAKPLSKRYAFGASFVFAVHCAFAPDVVACLQSAPLSAILQKGGNHFVGAVVAQVLTTSIDAKHIEDLPFGPTVDHYVLDDLPEATIKAGKHNHVPLVIGTNAQEFEFAIPSSLIPSLPILSCVEYVALTTAMFPGLVPKLIATYPCNPLDPKSGYEKFIAVLTDAFFTCPSRRALRAAAATQSEPVYRYLYTHADSSGPNAGHHAYHAAEVPYVFGTLGTASYAPTPAESTLSQQMQAYWRNFAASGNPNGSGLPTWKAYDPTLDNALQLDTPIKGTSSIATTGCNFWDTVQ